MQKPCSLNSKARDLNGQQIKGKEMKDAKTMNTEPVKKLTDIFLPPALHEGALENTVGAYSLRVEGLTVSQIKEIFEDKFLGSMMWSEGAAYPTDGVKIQFTSPYAAPQPKAEPQEPVGEVAGYYERGFTEHKTLYGKLYNQDLPVGIKLYTTHQPAVQLEQVDLALELLAVCKAADGGASGWVSTARIREALASASAVPAQDDCETVDALLRGLGLDPERCRTEGGLLNVGKTLAMVKAAVPAVGQEGWKLVPTKLTPEMRIAQRGPGPRVLPAYVGASEKADALEDERYERLLAAAPEAHQRKAKGGEA